VTAPPGRSKNATVGAKAMEVVSNDAVMPVLGAALLVFGWLSVLPRGDLALWEHGLMMPAMLVPMFFRLGLYTSKHSHHQTTARAAPRAARNAHAR